MLLLWLSEVLSFSLFITLLLFNEEEYVEGIGIVKWYREERVDGINWKIGVKGEIVFYKMFFFKKYDFILGMYGLWRVLL